MITTSDCALQQPSSFSKPAFKIQSLVMSVQDNNLEVTIESPHLKPNYYTVAVQDDQIVLRIYHLDSNTSKGKFCLTPSFTNHFFTLPKKGYNHILNLEVRDGVLQLTLGIKDKTQNITRLHYSGVA
jgi:HSP20 family molecular chaperone IbpA